MPAMERGSRPPGRGFGGRSGGGRPGGYGGGRGGGGGYGGRGGGGGGRGGGGRNRRPPKPPTLLGEPSPSLAKLQRMNTKQLQEHLERLTTEKERLNQKIARLQAMDEPREEQIKNLLEQVARLEALEKLTRERLEEKLRRAKEYHERNGNR
jgi:hypothetical protein